MKKDDEAEVTASEWSAIWSEAGRAGATREIRHAEMLFYDRWLDEKEMQVLTQYLSNKYKLPKDNDEKDER